MAVFVDPRWADTYPVASEKDLDRTEYMENRSNILLVSVGAAIQNLQLATTAVGLTSAWLSGGGEPQTASALQKLLGFPSSHIPYGIVPIGWPRRKAESRWRRPIDEVVHWNGVTLANLRTQEDIDHYLTKTATLNLQDIEPKTTFEAPNDGRSTGRQPITKLSIL